METPPLLRTRNLIPVPSVDTEYVVARKKAHMVDGDLLTSDATYLVHQTNCVTKGGKGLSKAMFDTFPHADLYKTRTTHSDPGSIHVMGNGKDERWVVNLMGQRYPGGPKTYETKDMRLRWFASGLVKLAVLVQQQSPDVSVAFPSGIGCGLAGGDWELYKKLLDGFAEQVHPRPVFIVKHHQS